VSHEGKPIPVPDQWRTLFAPWEEEQSRWVIRGGCLWARSRL